MPWKNLRRKVNMWSRILNVQSVYLVFIRESPRLHGRFPGPRNRPELTQRNGQQRNTRTGTTSA